jgi:hypothetical protein
MSTLFVSNLISADDQVTQVLSSVQNVTSQRAGQFTLKQGEQQTLISDEWCALSLRVVGRLKISTTSTDWDDTTPITGDVETFGIKNYPGTYLHVTKPSTFVLTALDDDVSVQYLLVTLADDSQI